MWGKLFGSKNKTPEDVVKTLRDGLREIARLSQSSQTRDAETSPLSAVSDGHDVDDKDKQRDWRLGKANDEVSKAMQALKVVLFGDASNEIAVKTQDVNQVIRLAYETDLLDVMTRFLSVMQFETRKDAVQIFNNLLRRESETRTKAMTSLRNDDDNGDNDTEVNKKKYDSNLDDSIEYSIVHKVSEDDGQIIGTLMDGYENGDIALNCGQMLRECIKHERLLKLVLESGQVWKFFRLVEKNDFDVASDAFSTFKDCLMRHTATSAKFIEGVIDRFEGEYNTLLASPNYVTRRQSLKLLGEMLLERCNFKIMTHYIASASNLRLAMNLLLDNRRNIQFEAFHVFKIFVANPKKPAQIQTILLRNRDKMLNYLHDFLSDREDEQFQEDRRLVIQEIQSLRPAGNTSSNSANVNNGSNTQIIF